MISVQDYVDLEHALLHMKHQVRDSLEDAKRLIPKFSEPEELYYWLRKKVTYVKDPDDRELFMTLGTFASGTRTGVPWGGDCDDFTIAAMSAFYANDFLPAYVILVGRSSGGPTHVYAGVDDGGIVPFDLTNEDYGYERRTYKYQQILPFTLFDL
jgi:hypothetical protein